MKRIYIVVEGQTEQEFVNEVLRPYFNKFEIYNVTPLLLRTSRIGRGGFVNYQHMKNTIMPQLKSMANDLIITSLVDFFRIPNNIPNYEKCMALSNKIDRINSLEQAINDDIDDDRFFSYIQLHEFEALIFANNNGFEKYCSDNVISETNKIIQSYDNPENINSTPEGAPSKRILSVFHSYDKVNDGNILALEVGINEMLNKCPRFNLWINKIICSAKD